jgi:hypothetical protein
MAPALARMRLRALRSDLIDPTIAREPAGNTVAPRSINRAFRIARGLEHQDANSLHPLLLLRASST